MAIDVVVRTAGNCITVVSDPIAHNPDTLVINGSHLKLEGGGVELPLGRLKPEMAKASRECGIAILVIMDGPFVQSSRPLQIRRISPEK